MKNLVIAQVTDFFGSVCNYIIWLFSVLLGALLTALGYPKEVLVFIVVLIIVDILTKHYSLVRAKYNTFTLRKYFTAWKERVLTSRGMKNGIGVKVILYTPVLYIAHKASVLPEIMYGQTISSVLYSFLIIIEVVSILENYVDAGHTNLIPFLKFFKKKQLELFGEDFNKKEGK